MTASAAAPVLTLIDFAGLAGWADHDASAALAAFRRSADEIIAQGKAFARPPEFGGTRQDWLPACDAARTARDARGFFEKWFTPCAVSDPQRPAGLFTGYYEPEAAARLTPASGFPAPVLRAPADLIAFDAAQKAATGLSYGRLLDGRPEAYFTRREIEAGALAGRGLEIAWLASWADLFFIHIQGSGRLRLPGGQVIRLAFAAKNGQPYSGIGHKLVQRGVLAPESMSMQALRRWMAANPDAARTLMQENASYIFFREVAVADPALGPPGAQQVNLTPRLSLAVDRRYWVFGTPVWLETQAPMGETARLHPFRELMVAQDTGTAITGHARGDVFWGAGEAAALTAGHMQSPGRMTVLLPRPLARRLTGAP